MTSKTAPQRATTASGSAASSSPSELPAVSSGTSPGRSNRTKGTDTTKGKLTIVELPITELRIADYNPRRMTKKQEDDLRRSLEGFGIVEPAVVNIHPKRRHVIVGGASRVRLAQRMGRKSFPCVLVNLTLDREKELNIRLNKNTGEFDEDLLVANFDYLKLIEFGFDERDVAPTIETAPTATSEDVKPFKRTHILISFSPDKFLELQPLIAKLETIPGIDIEQGSN